MVSDLELVNTIIVVIIINDTYNAAADNSNIIIMTENKYGY